MKAGLMWVGFRRFVAAMVLVGIGLAGSQIFSAGGLWAADVAALIKKLDRSEWEIVSEAVIDRLPNLIKGKEERALFNEMMKRSQQVAAMAEALNSGNYRGLGALSAQILKGNLEKMVASRFGEDSRLYRSIQLVKSDPELAKELTRAALNTDTTAAEEAINKSLRKYAQNHVSKLRQQGIKFWKDMYRGVIPLGDRLAALGVDPVDLYLQGISEWADFTDQARRSFNSTMLNCLALRYRKIRNDGYSGDDARLEIENFDTGTGIGNNFKCSAEMDKLRGVAGEKSWSRWIADFFTDTGRSTVALAELGMTSGEIVDLIEQYEREGGQDKYLDFSTWLQKRLIKNVQTRKEGLTRPILEAQKKVAREQLAEANRLMAAIEAEINKLERKKPKQPQQAKPRGKEDQPVAGGKGAGQPGPRANGDGGTGKEKPEPPKVTVQCEKLTALVSSVKRRLSGARIDSPLRLIAELGGAETAARKEGNCAAEVIASAAENRSRLQAIATLRQKITAAISACNIDSIASLKAEISRASRSFFASEESLLETMKTGVSVFKTGRAAYEAGKYRQAKGQLQRSLNAFRELPSGACQTYAERARKGVGIIEKIQVQQALVNRAIASCDTDKLKKILGAYKDKKHRFYRGAIARIEAALPKCEKDDRIIAEGKFCDAARNKLSAARADFNANRLKNAASALRELDAELVPSKTKRCEELKGKVRQGLQNISILRAENTRLRQAAADCKIEMLDQLKARYLGKDHPWYEEAAMYARSSLQNCRRRQVVDAEAECRREASLTGKVFAGVTYKESGAPKCNFCEAGYKRDGNVCVPDRALAVADCRRMAASKGKVYAKTEIRNNGESICHWCEPGQIYKNGQCGSPMAHAQIECRQMAARKGKVYANAQILRNGQVRCQWCEPGQYYSNGQCFSRVVRTCPAGYVLRGTRCYPRGGGQLSGGGRVPSGNKSTKVPCMVDLTTGGWRRTPDCEVPR